MGAMNVLKISVFCILLGLVNPLLAQNNTNTNKFRQLYMELPTPNVYRTASGAPGHGYYQQQADYNIEIELDDTKATISGKETITYHNNSPDPLTYLWVQLDQNRRAPTSDTYLTEESEIRDQMSFNDILGHQRALAFDGGFKILSVKDSKGGNLPYTINKTMMRVDLPATLAPGQKYVFQVEWWYNVNNRDVVGGRSGYEHFEEDDNNLYTIAQFYPRMAVYNDVEGWQNKQFLGRGEFTLPFGNFNVSITVPSDHIVAATGELTNATKILTVQQQQRFKDAHSSFEKPVFIVTEEEALKNESQKATTKKTWVFKAENVRDFAFASSRKFIWDAMAVKFGDRVTMAMSAYPKEGAPLWQKYSTKVVAHTIRTYSKYTIDYPYPAAWSINAKDMGMEYPMICFNFGRPEKDGTYSRGTKYGNIGVIIHEVGHNFFPMIINSDERQWTWMDEGLNTFVQYLTEQEWERGYPSRRGPAYKITDYMKGDKSTISPIMTNSESIHQFGNNAYGKPATALNILRETVMGRELFDYAFKEYCRRWAFKHPSPADLFRTMEDASAVDLDWFWRGWFFTTDHCDISLDEVHWYKMNTGDPAVEKPFAKADQNYGEEFIGDSRNKTAISQTITEKDPATVDFYNTYDPFAVNAIDKRDYDNYLSRLTDEEKALLKENMNYYQLDFTNVGGLVMPLILEFSFTDGSKEVVRIPAEIWRRNNEKVSKVFFFKKELSSVELDPFLETADTETFNNHWPRKAEPSRFKLFKARENQAENEMQLDRRAKELEKGGGSEKP
ncbi:MAG: M1 family metallopeptidase [Bacteroidia bacterium]|nr:M1 family metallopeptidase [Bacteroidia bacterium]